MLSAATQLFGSRRLSKPQVLSYLLSLLLLTIALLTLWIGHWLPSNLPDKIEVREIDIAAPAPPPPPPPPMQQNTVETTLSIEVQGSGVSLPKIELKPVLTAIKPDVPTIDSHPSQWQTLTVDWETFELNQLDSLPTLLTPLRVTIPKSLSRRGINRVLIKLDIMIDQQGVVTLIEIVENPYPALLTEIQRLVKSSRFTAPSKDDEAVRARFIWPVEIKS